jgi:hypothetical protein
MAQRTTVLGWLEATQAPAPTQTGPPETPGREEDLDTSFGPDPLTKVRQEEGPVAIHSGPLTEAREDDRAPLSRETRERQDD